MYRNCFLNLRILTEIGRGLLIGQFVTIYERGGPAPKVYATQRAVVIPCYLIRRILHPAGWGPIARDARINFGNDRIGFCDPSLMKKIEKGTEDLVHGLHFPPIVKGEPGSGQGLEFGNR